MLKRTIIYLLRNDLRLHDNECLVWAHRNADYVLPVYCFDPNHFKGTYHYNLPKTNKFRAKFLTESVANLRENLKKRGSNLIVRQEEPIKVIKELIDQCQSSAPVKSLVFQKEITQEETDIEKSLYSLCKGLGIEVKSFWGLTLYHEDDLLFTKSRVPDVFTGFRKKTENQVDIRQLFDEPRDYKKLPPVRNGVLGDIPSLENLGLDKFTMHHRTAFPYKGGETSGLKRIEDYCWKSNHIAKYKETRNGLIGTEYSTKFSPWLGLGCLSPRMIYYKVKKYEEDRVQNISTYWVIFELIWRDFFKFLCAKYGNKIFFPGGLKNMNIKWSYDKKAMSAWVNGETGVPFVDANMRELLHTGWMSNRGRQNVASYLVNDLKIDWRFGAEYFESMLLDHDVCSNYGNWNFVGDRTFNIIKQGLDYDAKGDYVKVWMEELGDVPNDKIHTPWLLLNRPKEYPNPLKKNSDWERYYPKGGFKGKQNVSKNKYQKKGMDFYFKSGGSRY